MNSRYQVALDDQVIVFCSTNNDTLALIIDFNVLVAKFQDEPGSLFRFVFPLNGRQHAGCFFGVPEQFIKRNFIEFATNRRDIDLTCLLLEFGVHSFDGATGNHDLTCLGLRRHPIGSVHCSAEYVVLLLNHGTEVTANTNGDRNMVILFAIG